jgi:hypothetical protein
VVGYVVLGAAICSLRRWVESPCVCSQPAQYLAIQLQSPSQIYNRISDLSPPSTDLLPRSSWLGLQSVVRQSLDFSAAMSNFHRKFPSKYTPLLLSIHTPTTQPSLRSHCSPSPRGLHSNLTRTSSIFTISLLYRIIIINLF